MTKSDINMHGQNQVSAPKELISKLGNELAPPLFRLSVTGGAKMTTQRHTNNRQPWSLIPDVWKGNDALLVLRRFNTR